MCKFSIDCFRVSKFTNDNSAFYCFNYSIFISIKPISNIISNMSIITFWISE